MTQSALDATDPFPDASKKWVYPFGEGGAKMAGLLGGKGEDFRRCGVGDGRRW